MKVPFMFIHIGVGIRVLWLLLLSCTVQAADSRKIVLAVADFQNSSPQTEDEAYGVALAQMILTDIVRSDRISVVERARLDAVITELELGKTDLMDKDTVLSMGHGVGASHIIVGDFMVLNDRIRINARVVDVGTSVVTVSGSVSGRKQQIFELETELVDKLIGQIGVTRHKRNHVDEAQSWEAFSGFSNSLQAYDFFLRSLYQTKMLDSIFELAILRCMKDGNAYRAYQVSQQAQMYGQQLVRHIAQRPDYESDLLKLYFEQLSKGAAAMTRSYKAGIPALQSKDMLKWQVAHDQGEQIYRQSFEGEVGDNTANQIGKLLGVDFIKSAQKLGYQEQQIKDALESLADRDTVFFKEAMGLMQKHQMEGEWMGRSCPEGVLIDRTSMLWTGGK